MEGGVLRIDVALYGSIARVLGGKHLAQEEVELPEGSTFGDLLRQLYLSPEAVGLVFINAVLHNLPGLQLSLEDPLHEGDHVGIFEVSYVWPYHYRGGAPMSPRLQAYVSTHEYLRHRPRSRPRGGET